ncbi:hypothetical protein F2S72_09300 [Pseudomonas syringae pv. actinidiae]|nr:hypothetical protein [Pseudomonas syringae pv. actinidiae]
MTIQESPESAMLTWKGLSSLPIPKEVQLSSDSFDIEMRREGISALPSPFNRADCWVSCREAWPHVDPDFEGLMFITIVIQGDHRYSQLMPNHTHTVRGVFPGSIFTTDPMALHWLAPNSDSGVGFVGLQFEVPYIDIDIFYADLLEELSAVGDVRSNKAAYCDSLLVASGDYVGVPPGPLARRMVGSSNAGARGIPK